MFPTELVVNPPDYITIDSWEKLCVQIGRKNLSYRHTEHVLEFFRTLPATNNYFDLVSGHSDYCLCLQREHPVNNDLWAKAFMTNWQNYANYKDNYVGVYVACFQPAPSCDINDKFSLKTDRHTWQTFNEIDPAIKNWYTTNLNCEDPRAKLIPFGMNSDKLGLDYLSIIAMERCEKKGLLYVNFQPDTMQRQFLKNMYKDVSWVTFRQSANLPVSQYFKEMAEHKFILCPTGCGLDSYRIWESLYLGCIPIIEDSVFSRKLLEAGLPIVSKNLFDLNSESLNSVWNDFEADWLYSSMEFAKLSYWRDLLSREQD